MIAAIDAEEGSGGSVAYGMHDAHTVHTVHVHREPPKRTNPNGPCSTTLEVRPGTTVPAVLAMVSERLGFAAGRLELPEGGGAVATARELFAVPEQTVLSVFELEPDAAGQTVTAAAAGQTATAAAPASAATAAGLSWDHDLDSVDGKTTFELYLEKSGSTEAIASIPGKPDSDPRVRRQRARLRSRLNAVTKAVLRDRIEPFVNQKFAKTCGGRCRACFSLVRRYRQKERTTVDAHFDIQAQVTVVVSLGRYGVDFDGGLFVSTGRATGRIDVPLGSGDAVAHESDLLHGVNVRRGSRVSWVMWFKAVDDPAQCDGADMSTWHLAEAESGDPLAMFLHAKRLGSPRASAFWMAKAAEGGFPRAMNELGQMFKDGNGVGQDTNMALRWFERATHGVAGGGEPDAMYNLGLTRLQSGIGNVEANVALFREAAELGMGLAAVNLGVAYMNGAGVAKNESAALEWFERSDDADALMRAVGIIMGGGGRGGKGGKGGGKGGRGGGIDAIRRVQRLLARAAVLGHTGAKTQMARMAGGGEGGGSRGRGPGPGSGRGGVARAGTQRQEL